MGISQAASPRRLRRPLPRPRAIRWYGAWSRQPTFLARAHDGGDVTVTSELGKGSGCTPTDQYGPLSPTPQGPVVDMACPWLDYHWRGTSTAGPSHYPRKRTLAVSLRTDGATHIWELPGRYARFRASLSQARAMSIKMSRIRKLGARSDIYDIRPRVHCTPPPKSSLPPDLPAVTTLDARASYLTVSQRPTTRATGHTVPAPAAAAAPEHRCAAARCQVPHHGRPAARRNLRRDLGGIGRRKRRSDDRRRLRIRLRIGCRIDRGCPLCRPSALVGQIGLIA